MFSYNKYTYYFLVLNIFKKTPLFIYLIHTLLHIELCVTSQEEDERPRQSVVFSSWVKPASFSLYIHSEMEIHTEG